MYLRRLHVKNVKLLRDVEIDFTNADGSPRMWTVFVGENRLCKTTLLQTIAVAASGPDKGTHLATDVIESWPDLRRPDGSISIDAEFGFSAARHVRRLYSPGVGVINRTFAVPPRLRTSVGLKVGRGVFEGVSRYDHPIEGGGRRGSAHLGAARERRRLVGRRVWHLSAAAFVGDDRYQPPTRPFVRPAEAPFRG